MFKRKVQWPEGKQFAFTIVDDTDNATVGKIKPIYDLLKQLEFKTTKTVWTLPIRGDETHYRFTETLENENYRNFILDLQSSGFEIAMHGIRGTSSERDQVIQGMEKYKDIIGSYPSIHINHARNKDNLYWGLERLHKWQLKLKRYAGDGTAGYGHKENQQYFWGDLAKKHVKYVRNNVFFDINTLKCDPFMPYYDGRFPYVNSWFSSSDGNDAHAFCRLLAPRNLNRLEKEGGLCIVYTHFGGQYENNTFLGPDGGVVPQVADVLHKLSERNGWYVPAGEILNYLRSDPIPSINLLQQITLFKNQKMDRLKYALRSS